MSNKPSFPTSRVEIAGVPIARIAEQFSTPVFVYDAEMIRLRIADLAPFDHVRYAQKACSNLSILELIRGEGVLVDAVSAYEIRRALAVGYLAGSSTDGTPPVIVYTADIFDRESLELVVEHDIHVNCGSIDMIDQLGAVVSDREITLRINPGFGHGHSQKTNTGGDSSKHGIWHEQLGECLERAEKNSLKITGLHMHIGSGTDMEHLAQVCGVMEKTALEAGPTITSISTGGGMPTPYTEDDEFIDVGPYFQLWDATRKRLEAAFGHPVSLETEPGRYLVAESGYLVSEIRAIKSQGANRFYLVDAGFTNLARPILYGAYHPISIVPSDGDLNRAEQDVTVGGPLCESGDIFTQEEGGYVAKRRLPEASVGELLVLECAGAYGAVMGSNYNSKPMAPEVLIDGGQMKLIRRRQSFDELVAIERV